jgi:hypothetical protein
MENQRMGLISSHCLFSSTGVVPVSIGASVFRGDDTILMGGPGWNSIIYIYLVDHMVVNTLSILSTIWL